MRRHLPAQSGASSGLERRSRWSVTLAVPGAEIFRFAWRSDRDETREAVGLRKQDPTAVTPFDVGRSEATSATAGSSLLLRWGRRRPKLTGAPARRGSHTPLAGWVLPSGATGPTLPRVTPTVSPTRGSAEGMARVTLFIGGPREAKSGDVGHLPRAGRSERSDPRARRTRMGGPRRRMLVRSAGGSCRSERPALPPTGCQR
jgi:hypothetical protein